MILRYVFTFITFVFLINCAGNNEKNNGLSDQIQFSPPEKQYTEAMLKFDNQQYDLATEQFKYIERIYPLSNEAIQSQIMQGFIKYILLDYDSAIIHFSKIINKYPSLKNIDYVYYMKAICFYEQISHEGLDGSFNDLALENLDQVIQRFPNSKYAKDSIQLNCLAPGFVESSYAENFKENRKDLYEWTIDQIPMGRWGKCEEMANIASFMISEQNSYMTGTTIYSDGGWTAK